MTLPGVMCSQIWFCATVAHAMMCSSSRVSNPARLRNPRPVGWFITAKLKRPGHESRGITPCLFDCSASTLRRR
ncbi:hypothetical protein B0J15DRAFT_193064 [Fusarium solani]|uniref:Secreted protein n=1 Tax=Fusarium solani TaxID=169388 RepID=A0A9P9L301_FUSSL|nr:uncharacterized protein B0J15DRAFT_193064 [Fusarium solani]KAH7273005.1 hypothetical protein B0J15DRAFT_193064 [Fusarium solani]